ncbi:hypothetical protein CL655_03155 [bacterium]|nr:hypothetical protein [bacterium]
MGHAEYPNEGKMTKTLEEYSREKILSARNIDPSWIECADRNLLRSKLADVMQALYQLCNREYDEWCRRLQKCSKFVNDLRTFMLEAVAAVKLAGKPKAI